MFIYCILENNTNDESKFEEIKENLKVLKDKNSEIKN